MKSELLGFQKLLRNGVGLYILLSGLWIFYSDTVLFWLTDHITFFHPFPHLKGLTLVLMTGLFFRYGFKRYTQDLTGKQQVVESLNQELEYLFRHNPQPMWIFDPEGQKFLDVNEAAIQTYGYSHGEFLDLTLSAIANPIQCADSTLDYAVEQHQTKNDTILKVKVHTLPFLYQGKTVQLAMIQDITQQQQALEQLQNSEEQYRLLARNFPNGAVLLYDAHLRYLLADGKGIDQWSQLGKAVEGKTLCEVLPPETCDRLEPLYKKALTGEENTLELPLNNHIYLTHVLPVHNSNGHIEGGMSVTQDITERKRMEQQLEEYAFYDSVTHLPNKTWFLDRISQQLAATQQGQTGFFTILYVDLERYDSVKYSLGHSFAEQLLMATAERLAICLNLADPVARVSDQALGVILSNIHTEIDATAIAEYIQQQLGQPLEVQEQELFSSVNIGIAIVDSVELANQSAEHLLQAADTAMNHAKTSEDDYYAIFETEMYHQARQRFQLETDLRACIKREGFKIFYQPIISLATEEAIGFEALVRWEHPTKGWISPAEFIPVAEETGLIGLIDWWVLGEACRQLGKWQKRPGVRSNLIMSINTSGALLSQLGLMERMRQVTVGNGLRKGSLKLEVTERVMMEQQNAATGILDQIKNLRIQLSVDDFGTGYSCLERLHQLPIDTLKIDRSFVSRMTVDEDSLEIVRSIITLAHTLKMDVIAEGIETAEQIDLLRSLSCEYGQGYFFAKPLPPEEVEGLFESHWLQIHSS